MKRGGPQTSDMLTMTEFISRHDDLLSIVQVVDDPIYLDEPYVLSITYTYDPTAGPVTENCTGSSFAENGGRDRHWVPHFLPGQNSGIGEFLKTQSWIPFEPVRGGVKTIYPEYRACDRQERCAQRSHRPGVEVGQRCGEAHCRSESPRRAGPHDAGAGQHLHADRRRHQHHGIGRQGWHRAGQHWLGAGDRRSAGGAWRTGQDGGQCAGDEHLLRSELPGPAELVEPILQHRRRVATAGSSDALHHQHQRGSGACGWKRDARRVGTGSPRRRRGVRRRSARARRDSDDRRPRGCAHRDEHGDRQGPGGS